MSSFEIHQLTPRAHSIQSATPFLQSECTSGQLCGAAFANQGCYATPDYSTCHFDPSQGASVCTICICNGFDNGETGCDSRGSSTTITTNVPQASLFVGSASKPFVPFKSFVFILLWFSVWNFMSFLIFLFWYLSVCSNFSHSDFMLWICVKYAELNVIWCFHNFHEQG